MGNSYRIHQAGPESIELQLTSYLEEKLELPFEYEFQNITHLYIDFTDVEAINSGGIKIWVRFVEKLASYSNLKVYFRKCNRIIINQIYKTAGFIPRNAEVISILAPVFCEQCDRSFNVFQDMQLIPDDINDILIHMDPPQCGQFPSCKKHWEVDIHEEGFNRFLEITKKVS